MKLILASASPRRKELLARLTIPFTAIAPDCDEKTLPGESSEVTCLRLAREKAQKIEASYPNDVIVGADTLVELGDLVMGKPKNSSEAHQMLQTLSGKTHLVKTAVALIARNLDHYSEFIDTTEVTFYPLNRSEIEHYLSVYTPYDKAGAYGIQDWSAIFVEKVHGCYHNVVGFPLPRFYQHIKQTGLLTSLSRRNDL